MEQFIQNMLIGIRQWVNGKIANVNTAIEGKQDVLTAGDNIEITSGGTISATGIIDDSGVTSGSTFSSSKIIELLSNISQFTVRIVQVLPATGETHVIYFVPIETGATSGNDVMDEYMWIEGEWKMIGSTRVDMTDYYTVEEMNGLLDAKLDIPDISVQGVLDVLNESEVGN